MAEFPQPLLPTRSLTTTPDLADDPDIFPRLPGMKFVNRGTEWNTTRLRAKNGRVYKNQNWTSPINKFAASYASLNQSPARRDLDRIDEFFNLHSGGARNFFYYDPYRNTVVNQVIGNGDGETVDFELKRAVRRYMEPVYALVGTPTVLVNFEPVTNFSIPSPGVVQFDSPPTGIIAWSGLFMFWCEFTQDNLDVDQLNGHLFSNSGLAFQSIKV